jgi:hypothetical protein
MVNSPGKYSRTSRESGQAMLEYILVLVVTVSIVLAFSKRFAKPFGQYSGSLMGAYLGCLLDKGILPGLGAAADGDCGEEFKAIGDNPFTQGGGAAGGSQATNSQDAAAKNKGAGSAANEMTNSRGGNKGKGRRTTGRAGGSSYATDPVADGAGGRSAGDENVTTMPNPLPKTQYYKITRMGNISQSQRIREVGILGLAASQREAIKRQQAKVSTVANIEEEVGKDGKKKFNIKPSVKKVAAESAGEPMTFGKFVRFLIIGAIVLAIIIFLGSQINQVTQSWEKN